MDINNKKINLQSLVTKWAIKKLKDNKNAIAIVYGAGVGDKFIPDNFLTLCYNKKDLENATLNMKKRLSSRSSSEVQVLYRKDLEDIEDNSNFYTDIKESTNNKTILSTEQIKFFEKSKVRDKNNNLLICYHGTSTPGFDEFNHEGKNSQLGNYKFGKYNVNFFATNKEVAKGYTDIGVERDGNIYYCYLNIVNPYVVNNETQEDVENFLFRRWNNIKDKNIRERQINKFNNFWKKWGNKSLGKGDVKYVNKDLAVFNVALISSAERDQKDTAPYGRDEKYYDLTTLGDNTLYGGRHPLMYSYGLDEIFEADNYEEIRDHLVGDIDFEPDEYSLTTNDIIRFVLNMNEEEGTNYDGIIIPDIYDIGPRGSYWDTPQTTIYVTLISSNQIKSVTNKAPTNSNNINEAETTEIGEIHNIIDKHDIINAIENIEKFDTNWKISDNPNDGPLFILTNGKFLINTSTTNGSHDELITYLNTKLNIKMNDCSDILKLGIIRCNTNEDECYIQLNKDIPPTPAQYNALDLFLYYINNFETVQVFVPHSIDKLSNQIYSLEDVSNKYIIKRIKLYYASGRLVEHKAITFGDLDYAKKTDTQDMMAGRGSGHFGTGFYFVGKDGPYGIKNNKLLYDYNEKRPVYEIDLDKYNLYKPQSNSKAYELFDALRNINRNFKPNIDYGFDENKAEEIKNELYKLGSDLDDPYEYLDSENINLEDNINLDLDESLTQKEFNDKYKQELFNFIDKYDLKKYMWVNEYDIENDIKNHRLGKIDDEVRKGIHNKVYSIYELNMSIKELSKIFNITFDKIVNILTEVSKQNNNESLSTKFMKSLGYEGVDVTALNHDAEGLSGLDNFSYGSVIYDLKPNTYKRIMEPRK